MTGKTSPGDGERHAEAKKRVVDEFWNLAEFLCSAEEEVIWELATGQSGLQFWWWRKQRVHFRQRRRPMPE